MAALVMLRWPVVLGLVLAATGCGAGLIGGIAASERGGSGEAPVPELSLSPIVPLVPAPNTARSVVVANVQIAGNPRVRIDALGVGVDQGAPTVSAQGNSTLITFTVVTDPIRAVVADPTAAEVPAQLSVFVGDRLVAKPVPIVLARQPRATLVLDAGEQHRFLSPLGERVRVRVDGLRASSPADVQLLVTTPDPAAVVGEGQTRPVVTRVGTDLRFEDGAGGPSTEISALVPGNTFPVRAELVVRDAIAGQSTPIANAFYRPDIALALPSQGPTTGGSLLTLIGTALVPFDFSGSGPAPFAFERVQLSFTKGQRDTALPREDFRTAESGSDRLVFTMPAAPDGRPGEVDIVLRVTLDGVVAEVTASQEFLFANPDPFFGPLGIVLEQLPVTVAPIALDQPPGTGGAPDFVALTDQGGVGFLQLLLAQQNGMFQPFAAPRQVGNHEAAEEREPRDLGVGDFDDDGVPDVLLVNAGAGIAVHHLVLGQGRPLPPLGAVHRFLTAGGMHACRVGHFDGDDLPDVLLVPGPLAAPGQRPLLLLARPMGHGQPTFTAPIALPVRAFPYEAIETADLDGDGALDVALVSGTQGRLDVAFGAGDGSFPAANVTSLDFTVPGYTFAPNSPAVGLHACADGPQQSLALVLSGSTLGGPTPPTVTRLRQSARQFLAPVSADAAPQLPVEPIGRSLAADIDGVPPLEIVLAMRDVPVLVSLGMLRVGTPTGFQIVPGAIEGGAESPRRIQAIAFERAFPATASGREAVFLVHETIVDGAPERRLSTRLVDTGGGETLRLLPPDIGAQLAFAVEGIVAGSFHAESASSGGTVRDLALARSASGGGAIELVRNDGSGGVPIASIGIAVGGLLPSSLTLLPAAPGVIDSLAVCSRDSRVAVWLPGQPLAWSAPLRDALAPPLASLDLADSTRVERGDVDGDGVDDLVVLLSFDPAASGEGEAAIALLRGMPPPAPAAPQLRFHQPSALTPVHGRASAITLGDFTRNGPAAPHRLELAVAVPEGAFGADGNHVRFFRYVAGANPAADRFEPAAAPGGPQVLLAGSEPTLLAAGDFDRDGSSDLLVACRDDDTLRLYRNAAPVAPGATAVQVGALAEALGSPWQLAPGTPTLLRLADVNGDGSLDAVVWVEDEAGSGGARSTSVAVYLSSGAGAFDGPRPMSPTRIGNRNARLSGDLGDWNRDGVPDAFLAWNTLLPGGDINLRVLFGGTR